MLVTLNLSLLISDIKIRISKILIFIFFIVKIFISILILFYKINKSEKNILRNDTIQYEINILTIKKIFVIFILISFIDKLKN
jgi:hypothetical protein